MMYTRNKESFKKGSRKVHDPAQTSIINLVKDLMSQKAPDEQQPENMPKNIPANRPFSQKIPANEVHKNMLPPAAKFCESRYESSRENSLVIEHVFDFTNLQEHLHPRAHQQYLELLEAKINKLEQAIEQKDGRIRVMEQEQANRPSHATTPEGREKETLLGFYHQSRTCLVLMSAELIECKRIVAEIEGHPDRLKEINKMLSRTEGVLEVSRTMVEGKGREGSRRSWESGCDMEKLVETCKYQQRTIQFLQREGPRDSQFNELRLLRHQINRISAQNEKLLKRLAKKEVHSPTSEPDRVLRASIAQQLNSQHLQEMQKIREDHEAQLHSLKQELVEKTDMAIKFREQKDCLIGFLDEAREKATLFEARIRANEQELSYLNKKGKKQDRLSLDDERSVASTEEFMKALKPFPRYQSLLASIINVYEEKVSLLQEKVIEERTIKEKFMEWSGSVYKLLGSANIAQEVVEKHMEELYRMDRVMDDSKLERYLRQIRSLSVGVDENQVREMETELEDYILSLNNRNQVIKEVDIEDGSSVAVSESFTDREGDDVGE